MTLLDADVADLARQVVDEIDPTLDVRIVPSDQDDPYRWGTPAWTITAGSASSRLTADLTRDAAIARLRSDLAAP